MSTGSRLADNFALAFSEAMKKEKLEDSNEEFDVMYPTGFLALDYLNGSMIHVKSDKVETKYRSVGIADGSSNMFIGRSGCGKSTLVTQILGYIAKQHEQCHIFYDDIEKSLPMSRKEFTLGLNKEELDRKLHFRDKGITSENVYKRIQAIRDIKLAKKEDYLYDTGLLDTYGNKIIKMVPTLYFIDSFAMLMPEDIIDKEDIDAGMGATKIAKSNTSLIKKISQLLREANIILFSINHIMDDVQTGFLPKAAQISGLKQGERLPGGKTALYIANNMFRLDDKGTLKESEGFGINGTIVDITIVKSRSNQNKTSVPLIFNKSEGCFDQQLSLFYFLKTRGAISGAGKMYFDELPEVKFSQKEFKNILAESPELQLVFARKCREYLDPLLSDTANKELQEGTKTVDINALINSLD